MPPPPKSKLAGFERLFKPAAAAAAEKVHEVEDTIPDAQPPEGQAPEAPTGAPQVGEFSPRLRASLAGCSPLLRAIAQRLCAEERLSSVAHFREYEALVPLELRQERLRSAYAEATTRIQAQGAGKFRKKKQLEKDPAAPPKPRPAAFSGFAAYLTEHREEIRQSLPEGHKGTDIAKEAGARWKALSEEERKVYAAKGAEMAQAKETKANQKSMFDFKGAGATEDGTGREAAAGLEGAEDEGEDGGVRRKLFADAGPAPAPEEKKKQQKVKQRSLFDFKGSGEYSAEAAWAKADKEAADRRAQEEAERRAAAAEAERRKAAEAEAAAQRAAEVEAVEEEELLVVSGTSSSSSSSSDSSSSSEESSSNSEEARRRARRQARRRAKERAARKAKERAERKARRAARKEGAARQQEAMAEDSAAKRGLEGEVVLVQESQAAEEDAETQPAAKRGRLAEATLSQDLEQLLETEGALPAAGATLTQQLEHVIDTAAAETVPGLGGA